MNAVIDVDIGKHVEKQHQRIGGRGLVHLALKLHGTRRCLPVNAAQFIAVGVIAHAHYTRGVFQQATWSALIAKGMARR